jgi:hypothetical protein
MEEFIANEIALNARAECPYNCGRQRSKDFFYSFSLA